MPSFTGSVHVLELHVILEKRLEVESVTMLHLTKEKTQNVESQKYKHKGILINPQSFC